MPDFGTICHMRWIAISLFHQEYFENDERTPAFIITHHWEELRCEAGRLRFYRNDREPIEVQNLDEQSLDGSKAMQHHQQQI